MLDPMAVLVLALVVIGLALIAARRRRGRSADPERAILAAIVDAERDRHRDAALEATEAARRQIPPGMF